MTRLAPKSVKSKASFWTAGRFAGKRNMDVPCGALNGLATTPQNTTVRAPNFSNTYPEPRN
jgi:hypothetical protein